MSACTRSPELREAALKDGGEHRCVCPHTLIVTTGAGRSIPHDHQAWFRATAHAPAYRARPVATGGNRLLSCLRGMGMTVACVLATVAGLLWLPSLVRWCCWLRCRVTDVGGARTTRPGVEEPCRHCRTLESAAPTLERRLRPGGGSGIHVPVGPAPISLPWPRNRRWPGSRVLTRTDLSVPGAPAVAPLALGALAVLFVAGASGGRPMVWLNKSLPWRDRPHRPLCWCRSPRAIPA